MAEEKCYCPIIYVRGYAMTQGEIDDTTADPFCGFNLGSTVLRATPDARQIPRKFVFESPLVRLQSDHGYGDVYTDGVDIMDADWSGTIPMRSVVIFRYYDSASTLLGTGKTPEIEDFARDLARLILRVRELVVDERGITVPPQDFRCYLVAHSMGGLVCRTFLQNTKLGTPAEQKRAAQARRCVDKFFTYATPHNGIEVAGRNVPEWLSRNDISNFSRERMAEYLDLKALHRKTGRVDWLPESAFPSSRVFCMVGTNRGDYGAAAGLSRMFAGHGSDGLVRIANASVWGVNDQGKVSEPSATAYTYRAHSGYYGIVNSEEAYQNLVRFLFGDVRIDIWADVEDVRVPQELEEADGAGKLDGLYQFEVLAAPRGSRWFLTRRTSEEDSVAVRTHAQLRDTKNRNARRVYLSSTFLANRYRVSGRSTLAYSLTFGVRVPDYEVEKKFWPNRHYEGQYLFRDSVVIEMKPPSSDDGDWEVVYDWQSDNVGQSSTPLPAKQLKGGRVELDIPFSTGDATPPRSPGITGKLRFVVSEWNV